MHKCEKPLRRVLEPSVRSRHTAALCLADRISIGIALHIRDRLRLELAFISQKIPDCSRIRRDCAVAEPLMEQTRIDIDDRVLTVNDKDAPRRRARKACPEMPGSAQISAAT